MTQQIIRSGAVVNDGTGDTLRSGAEKINGNFTELYGLVAAAVYTLPAATTSSLGGVKVDGSTIIINQNGVISSSPQNPYSLPTAAANVLGGIKVGSRLSITNGVLSADVQVSNYTLPTAAANVLGGIKVGDRLSIDGNGVLSADAGGYTLPVAGEGLGGELGGVKVDGTTIIIADGVISTSGGTGDRLVNGLNEIVLEADGTISLPTLAVANGTGYTSTGPTLALGERTSNVVITQQEYDSDSRGNYNIEIRGQRGYGTWSTTGNGGFGSNIEIYGGQGGETSDDLGAGAQGGEGGYVFIRGGNGQAGEGGGFVELRAGDAQMSVGSSYNVYGGNVNLQAGNANNSIEANKGYGGNVAITAGQGNTVGQHGSVSINTINGNWEFTQDGRLRISNAYSLTAAQNSFINAGSAPTVAYTSLDGAIGGIKATIKVYARQADNIDGDHDEDTQMCEMVISTKRRFIDNGGTWIKTAVASVYGVTHTSTLPLATFTVNYVENYVSEPGATPRDVVQILAEPTAAVTGTDMWVMVTAIELTND